MIASDWLEQLGFLLVALFTLGCALGVILARRVMHAALWLLPTLFGVAGAFALMGAHVLFALQILVYAGAIAVLILFGVMLMEDNAARDRLPRWISKRLPVKYEPQTNVVLYYYSGMQHVIAGVLAAGGLFVVTVAALAEAAWFQQWKPLRPELPGRVVGTDVQRIGEMFLDAYLLPFEVASVVLLVALIGSVVIARRDPGDEKRSDPVQGGDGE